MSEPDFDLFEKFWKVPKLLNLLIQVILLSYWNEDEAGLKILKTILNNKSESRTVYSTKYFKPQNCYTAKKVENKCLRKCPTEELPTLTGSAQPQAYMAGDFCAQNRFQFHNFLMQFLKIVYVMLFPTKIQPK